MIIEIDQEADAAAFWAGHFFDAVGQVGLPNHAVQRGRRKWQMRWGIRAALRSLSVSCHLRNPGEQCFCVVRLLHQVDAFAVELVQRQRVWGVTR